MTLKIVFFKTVFVALIPAYCGYFFAIACLSLCEVSEYIWLKFLRVLCNLVISMNAVISTYDTLRQT